MENKEKTIKELIQSLNNSIQNIRDHPTEIDRIPSNLEIVVSGILGDSAMDFLFSPKLDNILNKLFDKIAKGEFSDIVKNEELITQTMDSLFGKGSFKGPISKSIIGNIKDTVNSKKFSEMNSNLGKTMVALKRLKLVEKNLKKGFKNFEHDKELLKKYKDSVYAIKQVIKLAERIYRNRKIINRKLYDGLNNIVHESFEIDETLR